MFNAAGRKQTAPPLHRRLRPLFRRVSIIICCIIMPTNSQAPEDPSRKPAQAYLGLRDFPKAIRKDATDSARSFCPKSIRETSVPQDLTRFFSSFSPRFLPT